MQNVADRLPPGPPESSFRQLVQLIADPVGLLERSRRAHGDLFTLRLPGMLPTVYCGDPEAVRIILAGGYEQFTRYAGGVEFLLGEQAVLFLDDDAHKRVRRLMAPAFNAERMRAYGHIMRAEADRLIDRWRDGQTLRLHDEMQELTLRVILRCVFGIEEGERFDRLHRLIVEFLNGMMSPQVFAASLSITGRRFHEALSWASERVRTRPLEPQHRPSRLPFLGLADRLGAIHALLDAEIARARADDEAEHERDDILAMLVAEPMRNDELRIHLLTLLFGGHETTSTTLCWVAHCLTGTSISRDRAALGCLDDELTAELGELDAFDPGVARKLPYLGACIQEAMRLFPIAPGVSRQLAHDMVLGGHELSAGTVVTPSMILVQRHPAIWEQPQVFRPERFLTAKVPTFHAFPFGAGPWRCIGAAFADYELRVVLARLFQRIRLVPAGSKPIKAEMRGFTVAPSAGLPVRVSRRR